MFGFYRNWFVFIKLNSKMATEVDKNWAFDAFNDGSIRKFRRRHIARLRMQALKYCLVLHRDCKRGSAPKVRAIFGRLCYTAKRNRRRFG